MGRIKFTGPGKGERRLQPPRTLLFNFDIGSAALKHTHHDFLRMYVEPVLSRGGSVTIVGLTSRTGTRSLNLHLSQQRADRTLAYLRQQVRNDFHVLNVVGYGEGPAERIGEADESEDPRFRSVMLFTSDNPTPPVPPAKIDLSPLLSGRILPGIDLGDNIQKGIDILQMLSSVGEYVPKIAEFASRAGFYLNIAAAIAQMPLLWWSVREQNLNNGRLEGFWDAIQDMADQFSDSRLDAPGAVWPPLVEPRPRLIPGELTLDQREWMAGRAEGCKFAYDLFRLSEGKGDEVVGGRKGLRNLYKQWGSGLSKGVRRAYEEKMGSDWPIRK